MKGGRNSIIDFSSKRQKLILVTSTYPYSVTEGDDVAKCL